MEQRASCAGVSTSDANRAVELIWMFKNFRFFSLSLFGSIYLLPNLYKRILLVYYNCFAHFVKFAILFNKTRLQLRNKFQLNNLLATFFLSLLNLTVNQICKKRMKCVRVVFIWPNASDNRMSISGNPVTFSFYLRSLEVCITWMWIISDVFLTMTIQMASSKSQYFFSVTQFNFSL